MFDGSLTGWGLLDEPLSIELAQGRAITATGGAAAGWLLKTLQAGGENGRTIAELGIGTNPGATITGAILEDEDERPLVLDRVGPDQIRVERESRPGRAVHRTSFEGAGASIS